MAVHVEEHAAGPAPSIDSPPFGCGLERAVAGTELAGEFRCPECGYGVVVQRVLPRCPMCGGTVWERRRPPVQRSGA